MATEKKKKEDIYADGPLPLRDPTAPTYAPGTAFGPPMPAGAKVLAAAPTAGASPGFRGNLPFANEVASVMQRGFRGGFAGAAPAAAAAAPMANAAAAPGAALLAQPLPAGVTQLPTQVVRAPAQTSGRPGVNVLSTSVPGISEVTGAADGSRTFTDRPDATAAAYAGSGKLPAAPLAGEGAKYLAGVPTLGSGPTSPTVTPGAPGPSPGLAARFAASDAAAIANEDTRSTLGNAARNARMRFENGGKMTPSQRRAAGEAYLATINGLQAPGQAQQAQAGTLAGLSINETGATQRAGMAADSQLRNTIAGRPDAPTITLEDGSVAQLGPGGRALSVLDQAGKPIRAARTKEDPTSKRADEVNARVADRAAKLMEASALTGTPLTVAQARQQAQELEGTTASKPTKADFLARAKEANPGYSDAEIEAEYNKRYGA